MRETNITIICENTSPPEANLLGEHGFAALVDVDGFRILFDTGQGSTLLKNAMHLAVDIVGIDSTVISHGHWDHAGGLRDLLLLRERALPVFTHPGIFCERYYLKKDRRTGELNYRFAGVPFTKDTLETEGAIVNFNRQPSRIADGVWLTGEIPRCTSFEQDVSGSLFVRSDKGELITDNVRDEQSLVIETEGGLIVIMGCGHPGVINTINYAVKITGIDELLAIVGGTHLMNSSEERIGQTIEVLRRFIPTLVATCHCTGLTANMRFEAELHGRFRKAEVGTVFRMP